MSNLFLSNAMQLQRLREREPWLHVLFWMSFLAFPFLKSIGRDTYPFHLSSELNDMFFGLVIFYFMYLVFFPSRNKFIPSIFLLILFGVAGYMNFSIHNWLFKGTHNREFWYYSFTYISTYFILALLAYVLYSIKEGYKKQTALDESYRKQQQAELSALRSQINPHFLFNTLNSIYSSALKKEDKTADMILKLSDNFRYVLREGQQERVPLKNEIAHLRDFIHLQEERLSNKILVQLSIHVDDEAQTIAPLLLISLVENAFKYTSVLPGGDHLIKIIIGLKKRNFTFCCENPFKISSSSVHHTKWKDSGIGISNTQKRLNLLYPNHHQLTIENDPPVFKIMLQIDL